MSTAEASRNLALYAKLPRLADAKLAILYALSRREWRDSFAFLHAWDESAWGEIADAHPEYLELCGR